MSNGYKKLADGSGRGEELESSAIRAIDAYRSIGRRADKIALALDEITMPGVIKTPMSEEDSLVIAIQDARVARSGGE